MLIVERRPGAGIRIGHDIHVRVVKVNGQRAKLGVDAPAGVPVLRDELVRDETKRDRAPAEPDPDVRLRILVVEDDAAHARIIRRILQRSGRCEVDVVRGWGEVARYAGEHRAESTRPQLILLDFRLPDRDGDEAVRLLRSTPEYEHVPIVMLSSDGSDHIAQRCLKAGANAYVTKGAGLPEFRDTVTSIVEFWRHAHRAA